MRHKSTIDQSYFDGMFAGNDDPWQFTTSDYEKAKYDHTLAVLKPRYSNVFEVGCANGVFTRRLAPKCDRLLAADISPNALRMATLRCQDIANVAFVHMNFPAQRPDETFDLITLSEIIYYWDDGDLAAAAMQLRQLTRFGAQIILVHWTGATDYPQTADDAVEKLLSALGDQCESVVSDRREKYRLDLWERR